MEQRLSLVTLGVMDLERSRRFYEQLGWKRSLAGAQGVVFFQTGGMAIALYPRVDLANDAGTPNDGQGFRGISLSLNVRRREDVNTVLREAVAAGATLLKAAHEAVWGGYLGHFSDPDGVVWEIAWNPAFPIAEDGSIQIPA